MRKIFAIVAALFMLQACGMTVCACEGESETAELTFEEVSEQQINYAVNCSVDVSLYFYGKDAYCTTSASGSKITKIKITQTLQKKKGGSWVDKTSWSNTFNGCTAFYSTSKSSVASGTYRVKTVVKVYNGGSCETITKYSGSAAC